MTRERFAEVVADVLDHLPALFRERIHNVAVLVEDYPPDQLPRPHAPRPRAGRPRQLLLGIFAGVPRTEKSVFSLPSGPDHIVLFQKNIEAVCGSEAEVAEQIRRTLLHELGHYFGMTEEELRGL
ncbi:MAG TPA: metallopeptidase family protein [Terriglobales bacterium]|jgi:predicted Zn-dependent protease with MMP-like domain|nr:metallopeptidase family protein [Terriglobales bacterium]